MTANNKTKLEFIRRSARSLISALVAGLLWAGWTFPATAAPVVIKLATLAPKDHSFHRSLLKMGQTWRQISKGQVELNIYAGGIQGGEEAIVERMRINQVQAGLLTVVGLAEIEPDVTGLQNLPMMFRSLDEADYVGSKLHPRLEEKLRAKGFLVLGWGDSGWVRFFSRESAVHVDDFKKLRMFTWSGSTEQVDLMKDAGFKPVSLETSDILVSLQNGLIDAVPVAPFFALSSQIYGPAPHMLELNWAPLIGASIITRKAWDRVPSDLQVEFKKAAEQAAREIKAAGRREMDESVKTMVEKWGLQVHKVTPEIEGEWRQLAEETYPKIRGNLVPADVFDEVRKLLADYRKQPPGPSAAAQ